MPKHHLIISGTGRAGTTFLVQLLTQLGLDTGFSDLTSGIYSNCNAGMELDITHPVAPYVVKSPHLCGEIEGLLDKGDIVIDCAIIPIRDLYASAESRREVSRQWKNKETPIPGGLWATINPRQQEAALATKMHLLVHALTKHDVPMIWLYFPRLVQDPDYLYGKLKSVLPGKNLEAFRLAFRAVSRPELVHNFQQKLPSKLPLLKWVENWFRR